MVTGTSPPSADANDPCFDAAERWFEGMGATAQARAMVEGTVDESALWRSFAGFGLAEMLAEETDPVERARLIAGVGRAAGRRLYVGPLAEAALALDATTSDPRLEAPSMLATLMRHEPSGDARAAVPYAASCESAVVLRGAGVVRLAIDRASLRRQADGTSLAWIAVPFDHLATIVPDQEARHDEAVDLLTLCTASRLVGVGQQALALATGHLMMRQQFKRPLAAFQALQHASADRHADLALAAALLAQVVDHWAEPALRRAALPALKAFASAQAVRTAEHAVQMMGAMGFAHEADAGLFLRHAMTLAARHGDAATHRAAFSAQALDFFAT